MRPCNKPHQELHRAPSGHKSKELMFSNQGMPCNRAKIQSPHQSLEAKPSSLASTSASRPFVVAQESAAAQCHRPCVHGTSGRQNRPMPVADVAACSCWTGFRLGFWFALLKNSYSMATALADAVANGWKGVSPRLRPHTKGDSFGKSARDMSAEDNATVQ